MWCLQQGGKGVVVGRILTSTGRNWVTITTQGSQHVAPYTHNDASKKEPSMEDEMRRRYGIDFSRARLGSFTQTPPHQENLFTNSPYITSFLTRVAPQEVLEAIWPDLTRFGERAVTEIYQLGRECERNQPFIRPFDAWGNRIDELVTCEAWKRLKGVSAEEGFIAAAYEGKYGEYDRLYQMVKLYVFSSVSGLYSCPLAMTDGAAKTARVMKSPHLEKAYQHLISRSPSQFWTSGQWMTEKKGGSDVNNATETLAVDAGDGSHRLFGYKWFSSATDADMSLTLASVVSEHQPTPKLRNLSMFYLETRNEDGKLNGMEIVKLKNKLGTRQLPTAELLLDGTVAQKVSDEGRGIASIANMLTITRLHNAVSACSIMRRMVQLSRDYSQRRWAFGQAVKGHVLHQLTSARLEVTTRGSEAFTFHLVRLLGREEAGTATKQESLVLRLLTPILKAHTAKAAMEVTSEALECFGGQGYIEDTGLPSHLRDAQVLPIWEGTTNIMSLDFLRAVVKSQGEALTALHEDVKGRIQAAESAGGPSALKDACQGVTRALGSVAGFLQEHPKLIQPAARDLALSIANIYVGSLLVEQAAWEKSATSVEAARHWCVDLGLTFLAPQQYKADNEALVMEDYHPSQVYGPLF